MTGQYFCCHWSNWSDFYSMYIIACPRGWWMISCNLDEFSAQWIKDMCQIGWANSSPSLHRTLHCEFPQKAEWMPTISELTNETYLHLLHIFPRRKGTLSRCTPPSLSVGSKGAVSWHWINILERISGGIWWTGDISAICMVLKVWSASHFCHSLWAALCRWLIFKSS